MSTNPGTTPPIVRFYDPTIQAPDSSGRTLSSILALPDTTLEFCHDYIQQLFPLPELSSIHPASPTIDRATFAAFRSDPRLRAQLSKSLTRMLHFYGFEQRPSRSSSSSQQGGGKSDPSNPSPNPTSIIITNDDDDDDDEIVLGPNFARASRNWVKRFDHNHLRLTRIIRSLRVLGLEASAHSLFRALVSVYDHGRSGISARSLMFWTRAAERPLYLAPEDDDERDDEEGRGRGRGRVGKDFLYEYEAGRVDHQQTKN